MTNKAPFTFDLQMFTEGGGSGDGGSGEGGSGNTPNGGASGAQGNVDEKGKEGQGGGGSGDNGQSDAEKAALRKENERLRKERQAEAEELQRLRDEREQRERSELEKKNEWKTLAEQAEQKRKDEVAALKKELKTRDRLFIAEKARAAAKEAGIIDPDDFLGTLDYSDLRFDAETGQVGGLTDMLAAVKTAKPHWFKADNSGNSGTGGNQNQGGQQDQQRGILTPPRKDAGSGGNVRDFSPAAMDDKSFSAELSRMGVRL